MNKYIKEGEKYLKNCVFDGLAHSYDVRTHNYVKPYPEVTGYILSYFCENYDVIDSNLLSAADYLVKIQNKEVGGFYSFESKDRLFVFDTSQILKGLCDLYQKTKNIKYKECAIKAGEFLLMMQLDNGALIPVYDCKSKEKIIDNRLYSIWNGPWSGLMGKMTEGFQALYDITSNPQYIDAKEKTANFYMTSDYIECTHPLGYWLEGLYEANMKEKVKEVLESQVIPRIEKNGYISYTNDLEYAYVSGCMQLGILLFKLGYKDSARLIRDYGRMVQGHHDSGGLFQYANSQGEVDSHIHTEINSWGTKYFCQLERMMEEDD